MGRAPRVEYAGAMYHVMNRGDQYEATFLDQSDGEIFLKTLEETCLASGWVIHSFALMRNHYHLLIETQRATLVAGMQYLNSSYTRRFNIKHKKVGHLFQGRYKALLVDGDSTGYFITVSDYIHLNPIRAKKVMDITGLLQDPWSSAGWLSGKRRGCPAWLRWERLYGELGLKDWKSRSRREFRIYLERRITDVTELEDPWKPIRQGWCLGSESFIQKAKARLEEMSEKPHERESWTGEAVEALEEELALRLFGEGMQRLGYSSVTEMTREDRFLLAKSLHCRTRVKLKWLARHFGVKTGGGMSYFLYRMGMQIQMNSKLQKKWRRLQIK